MTGPGSIKVGPAPSASPNPFQHVRASFPKSAPTGATFGHVGAPTVFQQQLTPTPLPPPPANEGMLALSGIDPATATAEQVRQLQDRLIELGYLPPQYRTQDPDYGVRIDAHTTQALNDLQASHNVTDAVPGSALVTPETAQALALPTYGGVHTRALYPISPRLPETAYQPYTGAWPPPPAIGAVLPMNPELAELLASGGQLDTTSTDVVRVGLLQARLLELGYLDPNVMTSPGYLRAYGQLTTQAVAAFQAAEGLPATGIADPETLARLAAPQAAGLGPFNGQAVGQYPATPAAPPNALLGEALELSEAQMYPTNPDGPFLANPNQDGLTVADSVAAWNNWCLAFVSRAFGQSVPLITTGGSAIGAFNQLDAAGQIVPPPAAGQPFPQDIPPGSPMFFAASAANGQAGHVAIFTGRYTADGVPIVRTTGWGAPGDEFYRPGIFEVPLTQLASGSGAYLGYGDLVPEG
jgi:peptidoglycan hydrolase-like protein with peptidoglycan-binding domain